MLQMNHLFIRDVSSPLYRQRDASIVALTKFMSTSLIEQCSASCADAAVKWVEEGQSQLTFDPKDSLKTPSGEKPLWGETFKLSWIQGGF